MKVVKILILMFVFAFTANSQILKNKVDVDVIATKKDIADKGISEEEVRARLVQKGFDPENINPNNIQEFEIAYNEVIKELESEKNVADKEFTIDDSTSNFEVKDKVPDETIEVQIKNSKNNVKSDSIIAEDDKEQQKSLREKKVERKEKEAEAIENKLERLTFEESLDKNSSFVFKDPNYIDEVYGHTIFANSEIGVIENINDTNVPFNYVLADGDEIMISIFGRSQVDLTYKIDNAGNIKAVRVGKVFLRGLTFDKAEKLLRKRFSRAYSFLPGQFEVHLKSARTVNIGVYGEVDSPGNYKISALNSPINALMASGGPLKNGSLRKIKIIKSTGKEYILDIYDYLANPNSVNSIQLDNNDIIHVPVIGNVVKVLGGVRRPMRFELGSNESLNDILKYAGGLRQSANTKNIQIVRVGSNGKKIIDIDYTKSSSFFLKDLDEVYIRKAPEQFNEYISVIGNVDYPGKFEWRNGITLEDALNKAEFSEFARRDLVFIYRKGIDGFLRLEKVNLDKVNPNAIKLNPKDRVSVMRKSSFMDKPLGIEILGQVRNPQSIEIKVDEKFRLSDMIVLSGGLKPNAYPTATITRKDISNPSRVIYKTVDVYNAINNENSVDNIILREGDVIKVFGNERFSDSDYEVGILGDVREGVSLRYDPSLTINDLLTLSGGLKDSASSKAILKRTELSGDVKYIKLNIREVEATGNSKIKLQPRDVIYTYNAYDFRDKFSVQITGEVNRPGEYDFDESLSLDNLLYMSGGLTNKAEGNNVDIYRVEFRENKSNRILHKKISIVENEIGEFVPSENVVIAPHDIIIVRPIPNYKLQQIVTVQGEVKYPGPYIIDDNSNLKSVIESAGGLTKRAFPLGATLTRNSNDLEGPIMINLQDALGKGKKHENITMMPGDVLYIPQNEDIVSIRVNGTRAKREYDDNLLVDDKLQISYQGKKSAKWYIDRFAGGFIGKDIDKKSVRVIEPSGRVRGTKRILGFYDYPTVIEGSTIAVDYKQQEDYDNRVNENDESIDWSKTITDSLGVITSVISVIILSKRLND